MEDLGQKRFGLIVGRRKTLLDLMPMRAFADTADVAAAVLYLASPAAKIVTGHVLAVDGGYLAR
ncbi:SDR family oxidoreductase [Mesorhizobium sp. B2-8-5]|uniref:SDR family oxidoreductase n=1 Tax=Mesorhizobium sp. B2-8-5 TaxID=2589903 RepID=UPI001126C6A8|nr:SDR family oxidoreductase [Mesorhizobium sp. B2-8-5]UCI28576.1 SDR family oxidoreductase [Mesorhizobium sp. B2-8-5]